MIMREVVITDIHYRMTMTAIWSLGRKGIDITAIAYEDIPQKERLGFYSKFITHQKVLPSPKQSIRYFVSGLLEVGEAILKRTGEKAVLVVPSSQTHEVIVRYDDQISLYFEYSLVSKEVLERANNTCLLSEVATDLKVPFPKTTWLQQDETIKTLSERITYPAVIKYQYAEKLNLKPEERYKIVHDKMSFESVYTKMHQIQPCPLAQAYISGNGYAVSAVFNEAHEPIEIFCHKRIREYPISGGPSTLCESIWDDRMVKYAIKLLTALDWKGFAMVEFKGDLKGELKLMEINPRFWGSMMLSLQSGADLPFAYYKSVLGLSTPHGGKVDFDNRYRLNVKMQFVLQDLLATKDYYLKAPYRINVLFNYFKDLLNPSVKDGILRHFDWRPGIRYFLNALFRH